MLSLLRQSFRSFTACVLATMFAVPPGVVAQVHVVSPADLQRQLLSDSHARRKNLETVRQFLSSDRAEAALRSAHINAVQVKTAVSSLSDAELANLAARARRTQADFAAGNMSDRDLLIILVAIAALILIIVAVR
jgi:hypothetical protein